jgi:hypothetical protein
MMANAAFYFGLVRKLAEDERPLWTQMSFSAAEENFHAGAREGIDAQVYWPGVGTVRATELVLRRLLTWADEGLGSWGVAAGHRDRLLGIIEQRCLANRNGARWQSETLAARSEADRHQALREVVRRYSEHMHSNEPVHTWPIG